MKSQLSIIAVALSVFACAGPNQQLECEPVPQGATTKIEEEMDIVKGSVPPSRTVDASDEYWGVDVADPYRWLEDVEDPEVKAWMDAQDKLARDSLEALPQREALVKRLTELFYVDVVTTPTRRGQRTFYSRRKADQEKRVYYWREGDKEEVLLDPNTLSEDGSTSVGVVAPSWDGELVVYALRENNADEATLHVKRVATGEVLDDLIEGAKYADPAWTPDASGFYYVYLPTDPAIPTAERPGWADIRYHALGTPQSEDIVIKEKLDDPTKFVGVDLSRDGRWLFYYIFNGWNSTELYIRDLQAEGESWQPFFTGRDAQIYVLPWQGQLYIVTNDEAPKWRVLKTSMDKLKREDWVEIIPEDADSVLENAQIIGGKLVLTRIKDAYNQLFVHDLEGKVLHEVELPGIGSVAAVRGLPESPEAYYAFQSFTIPPQVYATSVDSQQSELWAAVDVPIDPSPYEVESVRYPSRDGTPVSMFIVRRKDMKFDSSTPTLLYGYGGFNVSLTPVFRASIYAWLEAGGTYAVANLRGGGEYGEAWHRAGMKLNKQNVFNDFIAAAEYLIGEGYTSPKHLGIYGGSNGGLLVGAALTQRPDLFNAVVCAVPLLDMVRFHLFGSGKTWISEYGSSEESEDLFRAILAYSPYHQVVSGVEYPAVLFLSADSDDRVDPLHARKMAAMLQARSASTAPILLRIEENAGHGGADMVKSAVAQSADMYAFFMQTLHPAP